MTHIHHRQVVSSTRIQENLEETKKKGEMEGVISSHFPRGETSHISDYIVNLFSVKKACSLRM
jgi:hypothetical protein